MTNFARHSALVGNEKGEGNGGLGLGREEEKEVQHIRRGKL